MVHSRALAPMGTEHDDVEGRPPVNHGGPPWADAPRVAEPGAQEAPVADRPDGAEERGGRHRRARRKLGGGRHHLR